MSIRLCKFCGSLPMNLYKRNGSKLYHYTACEKCGIKTSLYEDKYDAEDAWNRLMDRFKNKTEKC